MTARLPLALTLLRPVIGLVFVPLAFHHAKAGLLVTLLLGGLLSDIADGIVARRLGLATLALRRLDTRADLIFYGCAIVGTLAYSSFPLACLGPWLAAYLLLFVARNLVDYLRYRASPSYHMWSGKLWSVILFVHLLVLLLGGQGRFLLPLAFACYAVNALEGIAASLVLPQPGKDIPSLWHVFQLR